MQSGVVLGDIGQGNGTATRPGTLDLVVDDLRFRALRASARTRDSATTLSPAGGSSPKVGRKLRMRVKAGQVTLQGFHRPDLDPQRSILRCCPR